jgi:hypothetical protein
MTQELAQQIDELKQKIMELDAKLTTLQQWIERDGTRATRHVELVEHVCEKVKQPIDYLVDKFTYVMLHHNPFMDSYQELG